MIVVNCVNLFLSENSAHIEVSNGKTYKILLKDYENLPFECSSNSRLENIVIDVKKLELNETNKYFDGDCIAFLIFLARKYTIYRSAISKIAMTDMPKKQLFWKLYLAVTQNYKQQKNTYKFKKNNETEIEPETFKTLCGLVCDEFEAAGYIDDYRYALDKAKSLKEYKKYGSRRIKDYLRQKGIASDIIDEVLEDEFFADEESEQENMKNLLKRKYGDNLYRLDITDRNEIQKAINMLVRNGYKYNDAKNAVTDIIDNNENNENNIDLDYIEYIDEDYNDDE